ncbi:hypothetical protein, partial [Pseudomonas helleri]|uniref:hypothetical protein n=1 Tax=Pseudomonas helleri TaxID=1608996 RepID=UPI002F354EA3
HQTGCFALELRGKGTALLGHQTPLWGEHSRLNECPVSLDHYTLLLFGETENGDVHETPVVSSGRAIKRGDEKILFVVPLVVFTRV